MSALLKDIDERTQLAGTNKLELLAFTLGRDTRIGFATPLLSNSC